MNFEIGTDIVNIIHLKETIKTNPHFLKKYYTFHELELAKILKNPYFFYATRFAAKEAIYKATNGEFEFHEIEILKDEYGKPVPKILHHNDIKIKLSLSYEKEYAIAFCIVLL